IADLEIDEEPSGRTFDLKTRRAQRHQRINRLTRHNRFQLASYDLYADLYRRSFHRVAADKSLQIALTHRGCRRCRRSFNGALECHLKFRKPGGLNLTLRVEREVDQRLAQILVSPSDSERIVVPVFQVSRKRGSRLDRQLPILPRDSRIAV